jgi:hypothetical protein
MKENTETRHAQQIQFGLIEQFLEVEELDCKLAVQEVGMHTENSYQWRTTHSFGRSAIQSCRWLMLGLIFFTLGISANATPIAITPTGEGRYLPGLFDQVGSVLVGQGQAGWHGFDISGLSGIQVGSVTYQFQQDESSNTPFFPLSIAVYDVSTPYTLLSTDRIPIDAEGNAIAADLHSGNVYATFAISAAGEGTTVDVELGQTAIRDLQAAINGGQQFFNIGIANTVFDANGYYQADSAQLIVVNAVPEPGSILLLGTGLLLLLLLKLRRPPIST